MAGKQIESEIIVSEQASTDGRCDGCGLKLPNYLFNHNRTLPSHIWDEWQSELVESWTHCPGCAEELIEFVSNNLSPVEDTSDPEACGFCSRGMKCEGTKRFALNQTQSPNYEEVWTTVALCSHCTDVIKTFVDAVPEHNISTADPHDERYYPPEIEEIEIENPVDQTDLGAVCRAFFDLLPDEPQGTELYLEAHSEPDRGGEGRPAEYLKARVEVIERKPGKRINAVSASVIGEAEGYIVDEELDTLLLAPYRTDCVDVSLLSREKGREKTEFRGRSTVIEPR